MKFLNCVPSFMTMLLCLSLTVTHPAGEAEKIYPPDPVATSPAQEHEEGEEIEDAQQSQEDSSTAEDSSDTLHQETLEPLSTGSEVLPEVEEEVTEPEVEEEPEEEPDSDMDLNQPLIPEEPKPEPVIPPEPEPTPPMTPAPSTGKTVTAENYTYGDVVPATSAVDNSFFANTAVIGDSRSQGLMTYGNFPAKGNFTGVALSVYNILDKDFIGGFTLEQALSKDRYDRFYIALGINCVGYPSRERFVSLYGDIVDLIRTYHPSAEIYVQAIIPVNEPMIYARGTGDYINNAVIREFNGLIQTLAKDKKLHYIDLYNYFVNDEGQLPPNSSSDGLHFGTEYSKLWVEYLKTHTNPKTSPSTASVTATQSALTSTPPETAPVLVLSTVPNG